MSDHKYERNGCKILNTETGETKVYKNHRGVNSINADKRASRDLQSQLGDGSLIVIKPEQE